MLYFGPGELLSYLIHLCIHSRIYSTLDRYEKVKRKKTEEHIVFLNFVTNSTSSSNSHTWIVYRFFLFPIISFFFFFLLLFCIAFALISYVSFFRFFSRAPFSDSSFSSLILSWFCSLIFFILSHRYRCRRYFFIAPIFVNVWNE